MKIDRLLTTTTLESPTFADQAHFPQDVAAAGGGGEVGGIDLIVQVITLRIIVVSSKVKMINNPRAAQNKTN